MINRKVTFGIAVSVLASLVIMGLKKNDSKETTIARQVINEHRAKKQEQTLKYIYMRLTTEIIDGTEDGELLELIYDNVSLKFKVNSTSEYETVMQLNQSQQAIYAIWVLEAEVNNGGFDQFYINSSGQYASAMPSYLKLVGANNIAKLVEKGNKIQKQKLSDDDRMDKLEELDDEFYDYPDNLHQLQIDYVKSHKEDFVD